MYLLSYMYLTAAAMDRLVAKPLDKGQFLMICLSYFGRCQAFVAGLQRKVANHCARSRHRAQRKVAHCCARSRCRAQRKVAHCCARSSCRAQRNVVSCCARSPLQCCKKRLGFRLLTSILDDACQDLTEGHVILSRRVFECWAGTVTAVQEKRSRHTQL
eukprot:COSAG01_NODE_12059_length_1806_cov_6.421207_2_plen_158_part_01